MILWKKYKGITPELIKKIGFKEEKSSSGHSTYSNNFIVLVRFKGSNDNFELRLAYIIKWGIPIEKCM